MTATVGKIAVARASTAPMQEVEHAILEAGVGIVGDRYAENLGTYTCYKEPGRQVTLISASGAAAALCTAGIDGVNVVDLRRNVILNGISAAELNATVGKTVQLGGVQVFVHRRCVPCMYNERLNGAEGLMHALWEAAGVSCEVLTGGLLKAGDCVVVGEAGGVQIDDGGKPAGFYTHPKRRSSQEAKACIPSREAAAALAARDPGGAWRLQKAYERVGISYFAGGMPEKAASPFKWRGKLQVMGMVIIAIAVLANAALIYGGLGSLARLKSS
ncbi:hypothetical protein AB1Y20_014500 [Prymnesium parvum]|uniref:MOSC domain-containing protein n=1 Tax=Prymnesium parvum TaxID=97485 RepID=A0AB34IAP2_PRYPA